MVEEKTIDRFRIDLPIIRAFAGWSIEYMAEMLDISRSSMQKIEGKPGVMNTVYYLAINQLITIEKRSNGALKVAMDVLNEADDSVTITRKELQNKASEVSVSVGRKKGMKVVKEELFQWMTNRLNNG